MRCWILTTKGVFDRSASTAKHVTISGWPAWRDLLTRCHRKNAPKTKKLGWAALFSDVREGADKLDALSVTATNAIILDLDDVGRQWPDPDAPYRTVSDTITLVTQALKGLGFAWWESWQSRPACPRLRIVLPLPGPIDPSLSSKMWTKLAQALIQVGIPTPDTTSRESTRLNLLPTVHSQWGVVEGSLAQPPKQEAPVPVVGVKPSPTLGPSEDLSLGGEVVLEWETGGFTGVSEVTPDILKGKARPTEPKRSRCRCPQATDTQSFSAFARFCRGLLYVTCTSTSHGHPSGATWSYSPSDATVTAMEVPHPYSRGATGALLKAGKEDKAGNVEYTTIAYTVPQVTTIFVDEENGEEWWKIEFSRFSGPPVEVVLRRDEVGSASKLIDRAGRMGMDVHECNKRELTRYLSDFVSHNHSKIRMQSVASRCGWFGAGYLWGLNWLSDAGGEEPPRELVVPSGDGRSQLAYGMRHQGTLDGWVKAAKLMLPFPLATVGLYVSLASVLVPRVECQAFVFEWASSTGTGKTTCLRIAASAWGNPDDLITGWDGTRVGLERRASFLSSMPMFKDDTKTTDGAKNSVDPEWAIYRVVSGEGRERAQPGGGMQQTSKWALNLLMTGEEAQYGAGQAGGARARLLSIQDPPFHLTTKDSVSKLVAPFADGTQANHGHIGPAFVAYVSGIPKTKLREAWNKRRSHYLTLLDGKHSAADRMSSHLALCELAGSILEQALGRQGSPLGANPREVVEELAAKIIEADMAAGDVDPFDRSVNEFYSWCVAHRSGFWSSDADESRGPASGWLGRWDGGELWSSLYAKPSAIERFLREGKYTGAAGNYATQWLKRGHIVAGVGRPMWRVRIAGASDWAYRLDKVAPFLVNGLDQMEPSPGFHVPVYEIEVV